jgi:predicted metal-dependent HD superfamily phosphohydrolase
VVAILDSGVMLKEIFFGLASGYTRDNIVIGNCWSEIEKNYSHPKRHYHTLDHLSNLFKVLGEVRSSISNWNTILFTLFYHDAVYNALKSDNEEKSAELAKLRMQELNVPLEMIDRSCRQILATKKHEVNEDPDTNFFTDADLSVLGAEWSVYVEYAANVRKEYSMYPDLLYKPGRRKVLQHFLSMPRIFKTDFFHSHYEAKARHNLQQELETL